VILTTRTVLTATIVACGDCILHLIVVFEVAIEVVLKNDVNFKTRDCKVEKWALLVQA